MQKYEYPIDLTSTQNVQNTQILKNNHSRFSIDLTRDEEGTSSDLTEYSHKNLKEEDSKLPYSGDFENPFLQSLTTVIKYIKKHTGQGQNRNKSQKVSKPVFSKTEEDLKLCQLGNSNEFLNSNLYENKNFPVSY